MRLSPFALAALLCAAPAVAQKGPPARPALRAGADTNNAQLYYDLGLERMEKRPQEAADAFYWALRLNPNWAEALYARRIALMLTDVNRLMSYRRGDKRTIEQMRGLDSLQLRALAQNPFLYLKLDRFLLDAVIRNISEQISRSDGGSAIATEYEIQNWLRQAPPDMQAWLAYSRGDFPTALQQYAVAIKRARYKASLRNDRGRLFYQLGQADSAYKEISLALEEMRKRDKKDLVFLYESKAVLEQSIGMIHEVRDQPDSAREAYGRALQEDLAYYPAHQRMAFLALSLKDTATALNEMSLAVELGGNDPMLRYVYAYTLAVSMKYAEAETQLRKATEIEPLFALPHYLLGVLYEQLQKPTEALGSYTNYLATASQNEPHRPEVEQRVKDLKIIQAAKPE